MPELPEVETIKRGLIPLIVKKKILKVEVLTEKSFQGKPEDALSEVVGLRRRGKALLVDLRNGHTLMIHLRMTGQLIYRGNACSELAQASPSDGTCSLSNSQQKPVVNPTKNKSGLNLISHSEKLDAAPQANITSPINSEVNFAGGHPNSSFTDALPNKQTRVIFVFNEGTLFFNDQRKFGFVKVLKTEVVEQEKFIAELGPEPWECRTNYLFTMCQRHAKAPIKAVLLDQKIIAGIGNIYADEALFYAKVHPATPAGRLTEEQIGKIIEGAARVMDASIDSGGSTMATYVKPDGTTGDYLENFAQVFRREGKGCPRCGTEILKTKVAGRGTHFCPECQKND